MINKIARYDILNTAHELVCNARVGWPAADSVWQLRQNWPRALGFDFLGYKMLQNGLSVASATLERGASRIFRFFEQGAPKKRIEKYVKHFLAWTKGGLGKLVNNIDVRNQLYYMLLNFPLCAGLNSKKGNVK
ncbi:hypothetical protein JYT19_01090 [Sulfobacillus acidophilus]|uniref:Uncharacterized protein n=1 Tax=Sulfobacillus acidophilus TaxID=53633 RepID=A0ABS3AVW7_9FIRM|nr:hypothetical protein [Sulfobacillus acidophilus]